MRCGFVWLMIWVRTLGSRAEDAIRDGDTVVFLGDSITAARQYSKVASHDC
jgi:hypothetical protein